jgi:hypothetical protein
MPATAESGARFPICCYIVPISERWEATVSEVVYVSKVRIERKSGPLRLAYLPGEPQPVVFSVHGAIAKHYKVDPAKLTESHAATLDYVIAGTAG